MICCLKLHLSQRRKTFSETFATNLASDSSVDSSVEGIWARLKTTMINMAGEVCGKSKKGVWRKETWWWNDEVESAVNEKRRLWKAWKKGGNKEDYLSAKRASKRAVFLARKKAEESQFSHIADNDPHLYRLAKQMRKENWDVVGEKCIRDDAGNLSFSDDAEKILEAAL